MCGLLQIRVKTKSKILKENGNSHIKTKFEQNNEYFKFSWCREKDNTEDKQR